MRLTREVRCSAAGRDSPLNTWAGANADQLADALWILRATVEGPIDHRTGYVCDLRRIDTLLRDVIAVELRRRLTSQDRAVPNPRNAAPPGQAGASLCGVFPLASAEFNPPLRLIALEWRASPYTRFAVFVRTPSASERAFLFQPATDGERTVVQITRSFEFCAAHRLSCEGWSDEENRRVFGKCSNPQGHGHNYVLEVTLSGTPDARSGLLLAIEQLDRIVKERVLDAFDHRNLNKEVPEFAATNPSVENIARVIWQRLRVSFDPAQLTNIRVWETPKTFADCVGES